MHSLFHPFFFVPQVSPLKWADPAWTRLVSSPIGLWIPVYTPKKKKEFQTSSIAWKNCSLFSFYYYFFMKCYDRVSRVLSWALLVNVAGKDFAGFASSKPKAHKLFKPISAQQPGPHKLSGRVKQSYSAILSTTSFQKSPPSFPPKLLSNGYYIQGQIRGCLSLGNVGRWGNLIYLSLK